MISSVKMVPQTPTRQSNPGASCSSPAGCESHSAEHVASLDRLPAKPTLQTTLML
jgi:hypothetical protein